MSSAIGIIILKTSNSKLGDKSVNILGKTCLEWVSLSFGNSLCGIVDYNIDDNIIDIIKPTVNITRKYTIVLYSDTPLVNIATIECAIDVMKSSDLYCLKISRGWIFVTDYLINLEILPNLSTTHLDNIDVDMICVDSFINVAKATKLLRDRILDYHMGNGVHIVDPNTVWIDCEVRIGKGTTIHPNNIIKNQTEIKEGVTLLSGNTIDNCILDNDCSVSNSMLLDSYVGQCTSIGPFARLRPESIIGNNCKIGNFVEIKKSLIGDNTKVAHHTYIGDAQVGKNCNFGCGVIIANYDGVNKNPTRIGSRVFIGANSTLIAPIILENNSFVAAGSTIINSVPEDSLAIARARQVNKQNWINKIKK
ncbi:MAG: hypothetical protein FWF56_01060 [Firmicutes bacterium]|nr:hypothetical protein [Bacillota bacterium]MCL1954247.1 hypothetical protein [Bacillota bacterium]